MKLLLVLTWWLLLGAWFCWLWWKVRKSNRPPEIRRDNVLDLTAMVGRRSK